MCPSTACTRVGSSLPGSLPIAHPPFYNPFLPMPSPIPLPQLPWLWSSSSLAQGEDHMTLTTPSSFGPQFPCVQDMEDTC